MMHPLIAAAMARPMTHVVISRYADGTEKRHETRSLGAAENWAIGQRRYIGRDLIERGTGRTVRIVAVIIEQLAPDFASMTATQLNDWYESNVGYRPQIDDPDMTDDDLRALCIEVEQVEATMIMTDRLNTQDFETRMEAEHALAFERFALVADARGLWRSHDGLVDAVIKQRTRDLRFYIVLFA